MHIDKFNLSVLSFLLCFYLALTKWSPLLLGQLFLKYFYLLIGEPKRKHKKLRLREVHSIHIILNLHKCENRKVHWFFGDLESWDWATSMIKLNRCNTYTFTIDQLLVDKNKWATSVGDLKQAKVNRKVFRLHSSSPWQFFFKVLTRDHLKGLIRTI
jgi:hypothetical protein